MKRSITRPIWAAAIVGVLAAGGAAYATIPTNGVISACYSKSGGTLRVIDASTGTCGTRETSLAWNVAGAQGPAGANGATGPAGPPGPTGAAGANGVSGREIVEAVSRDKPLPFDDFVMAICPVGKKVMGGGTMAQLYNDVGFVGLGAPAVTAMPFDSGSSGWDVKFVQPPVNGATKGTFTVRAICVTAG